MKKLIASAFVAVLMTAGLVVAEGAPAANAANHANVYPNSVGTSTKVTGKKRVHVGKRAKVRISVSNGAKGTVTITVRRGKKLVKRVTRVVDGAPIKARFKARKKGKYKVKAVFHPAAGTPFKASVSPKKVVRAR